MDSRHERCRSPALAVWGLLVLLLPLLGGCQARRADGAGHATRPGLNDPRFHVGALLHADDFEEGLERWHAEREQGGLVEAREGRLIMDVPRGCSVWFQPRLDGPVLIEYEVTAVQAGGANDRVSDLNCFWMARDARDPDDLLAVPRSGRFADYDSLRCYYVGLGGNANTTTRFRRYVGEPGNRPILPEHDLAGARFLITPNVPQRIQLVACGPHILYFRDGEKLFELHDPEPYTSGWFALRTVQNHMRVRHFRVYRLIPPFPD